MQHALYTRYKREEAYCTAASMAASWYCRPVQGWGSTLVGKLVEHLAVGACLDFRVRVVMVEGRDCTGNLVLKQLHHQRQSIWTGSLRIVHDVLAYVLARRSCCHHMRRTRVPSSVQLYPGLTGYRRFFGLFSVLVSISIAHRTFTPSRTAPRPRGCRRQLGGRVELGIGMTRHRSATLWRSHASMAYLTSS